MKKTISMVGIIAGIIFLLLAFAVKIPDRKLSYFLIDEYVGGDAYNYIIEASILGGEIAGARTTRAVYAVGGSLLALISLQSLSEIQSSPISKKEQDQKQQEPTVDDARIGE